MKVLEILKEQYNMLSKDTDGVWIDPEKIDEAIKELEEYEDLKNRKCSNCLSKKHCDVVTQDEDNFYCSDWESINERD